MWDDIIAKVQQGKSYKFTSLSTNWYDHKTSLTSTHHTIIQEISAIEMLADTQHFNEETSASLTHWSMGVMDLRITISKQCPKCFSIHQFVSTKCTYHRCSTCKVLRNGCSYLTKLKSVLEFPSKKSNVSLKLHIEEVSWYTL